MDVTTVTKIIVAFATMLGVWKILYEIKNVRKSHLREEYEFSKKFLSEVSETSKKEFHPYPLEKGYQAIAGTDTVKADEVEYILSLEDPVQCLKDYVLSKQLMEKIKTVGDLQLNFKSKYTKKWVRDWLKGMYFIFYLICSFFALAPFIIQNHFKIELSTMVTLLLFTIPFGGLYAWGSVNAFMKLKRGECLIENQNKHTQRIIIETGKT